MVKASVDLNSVTEAPVKRRPKKIKQSLVDWESYSAILRYDMQRLVNNASTANIPISENDLNDFVDECSKTLYSTAIFCQNNVPTLTTNNLQNYPLGDY